MVWPFRKNTFEEIGYIKDQKGILRRYKREKHNWESHLSKTKAYIISQTECLSFDKIAVLGSGYLLDLPTEILLDRCSELHLYDVCHPQEVRDAYRWSCKMKFVEKDITNCAEAVRKATNEADILNIINQGTCASLDDEYDLVISLNILNQLDILLVDYILDKMQLSPQTEQLLREKIQNDHVALLSRSMSIIVADTDEIQTSLSSQHTCTKRNVFADIIIEGITSDIKAWQWHFDQTGHYLEDTTVAFSVTAATYHKKNQLCAE